MSTTSNLRKLLHRKAWEFATPCVASTSTGSFWAGDKGALMPNNDCQYLISGSSIVYNYNADQDAHMQIPSSGIAGVFGAGSCGEFRAIGMLGGALQNTATAGTVNTLVTNRSLMRDIRGSLLRVVAGTGMGYIGTVASNTIGNNATITLAVANAVAFDATTVFQVWSGSLWFFNAGSASVGFSVYDRATNSWTAKSVTNLPTAWGTCGQLVSTGSIDGGFETGTASSATATTLTKTGAVWPVNGYANAQARIVSGAGAGQVRTVVSNTVDTLTVGTTALTITALIRAVTGVVTMNVSGTLGANLKPSHGCTIAGCSDTTFNAVHTIQSVVGNVVTMKGASIVLVSANPTTMGTAQDTWAVNPDATSVFSLEGDDDNLYLMGNNVVTMYKYSILNNLWATVTPATARATVMGTGGTADWINGVTDSDWAGAQGKLHLQSGSQLKQNGRYIYSFNGSASSTMHIFDIALNTWLNVASQYGNATEVFGGGSCSVDYGDYIYIQKDATGRIFRFNIPNNTLEPWATNVYPQSSLCEGDKMAVITYKDGATKIPFIYTQLHSRNELLRMLVIG